MLELSKMKLIQIWHAATMVPGLFLSDMFYRIFCTCSILYHLSKACNSSYTNFLLRMDLMSQLVVCVIHASNNIVGRFIWYSIFYSMMLDLPTEKDTHIVLNGICMLISRQFSFFYFPIVLFTILHRYTRKEYWHSATHLWVHAAFYMDVMK